MASPKYSNISVREILSSISEDSFDYEHISEFDYEPVQFDFRTPTQLEPFIPRPCPEEHTLVIIKPTAVKYRSEIKRRIYDEGFYLLKERIVKVSPEVVSEFFTEHYGKPWFPKAVLKLSKGPWVIMILAKESAINDFKELMGPPRVSVARKLFPYSLRAMYGLKGDFATNGIHGSEDREHALREIHFFFPQAIPEPLSSVIKSLNYHKERFHFILIKSLGELYRYKTPNLLLWLTNWLKKYDPERPKMEITYPDDHQRQMKEAEAPEDFLMKCNIKVLQSLDKIKKCNIVTF
ncbi:hypothetical protein O3M35_007495 [Rhynocoris fuscipes]|uniref:Nucleoside diphosphate kinase-like domain-containing protein n=1 Tax=Rhynocoris fuscipes TaxID=488301 RepID=A0AAW1D9M2_9HEMI